MACLIVTLVNMKTWNSADRKEKLDSKDPTAYDTGAAAAGSGGGAMLWDRTLSELKLEYMDLDEFLSENGVAGKGNAALSPRHNPFRHSAGSLVDPNRLAQDPGGLQQQPDEPALAGPPPLPNGEPPGCPQQRLAHNASAMLAVLWPFLVIVVTILFPGLDAAEGACYSMQSLAEHFRGDEATARRPARDTMATGRRSGSPTATVVPIDCAFTKTDLALANLPGHDDFDPSHHPFSEDELKPQPIVKKSRKQFVPNELKDDKYWARRQKNNIAAKRSREVRRVKENQIVLRASYLEKENIALREEVHKLQQENDMLRKRLHEYEP
ncbi:thyrotroph embryonic factor-like [Dermacentor andersoni]|uniref:thyrotroph embryonic factor-like n=1 Tax=Dermacentor andersoni TaxID=34620 RepID=UPI003B3ADCDF